MTLRTHIRRAGLLPGLVLAAACGLATLAAPAAAQVPPSAGEAAGAR